jgi:L-2-amino-thiazoline-4-carboxylic acid hydrolase
MSRMTIDPETPEVTPVPADTLNEIGVLKRREIEARIIGPFIGVLALEFERERVVEILRETIVGVARQQGAGRAAQMGDKSLTAFASSTADWRKGDALQIELLERSEERYSFNVTRCRYAEMYRALGLADLGEVLSCNRDYSLIEGFNPDIELVREQTIMLGAPCCTFRYSKRKTGTLKEVV